MSSCLTPQPSHLENGGRSGPATHRAGARSKKHEDQSSRESIIGPLDSEGRNGDGLEKETRAADLADCTRNSLH